MTKTLLIGIFIACYFVAALLLVSGVLVLLVGCGTKPGDFAPDQTKWIIGNVH